MKTTLTKTLTGTALAAGLALALPATAVAQDDAEMVTVVKLSGIAWFDRMSQGIDRFAEDTGLNASQTGPSSADAALQIQIIEDLIARGVDAIGIVPNASEALEPVLGRAMDNDITVVSHEGAALQNVDYDVEAFDNAAYGEHLMEQLATRMDGAGQYAVFVGYLTSNTHADWVDAAIAYQEENYPDMELVTERLESEEQQQVAYQRVRELLRTNPEIAGIQGSAATDVVGAALAVEEAGLSDQVSIVGTSLPSIADRYLRDGTIDLISFWDPADAGYAMNEVARRVMNGESISSGDDLGVDGYSDVTVENGIVSGQAWVDVTADNVDEYDF